MVCHIYKMVYPLYTFHMHNFIFLVLQLLNVKFIVDSMLGNLAKYLRFMGYDTYYAKNDMNDNEILKICKSENRILITRDYELSKRCSNSVYLEKHELDYQLKYLIKKFNLNFEKVLTRCSLCNEELIKIEKEKIRDVVPENVYNIFNEFYICPKCNRVYWMGSHTKNILLRLEEIKNDN
ncbi:MAG: Mut7-C RNAse domain-containing protein [Thermoplasmata archaeon]